MVNEAEVAHRYEKTGLCSQIIAGLQLAGSEQPTSQDLGVVDEFHIGSSSATRFFSAALAATPRQKFWTLVAALAGRRVSLPRILAVM
jgi:hypothetical protein